MTKKSLLLKMKRGGAWEDPYGRNGVRSGTRCHAHHLQLPNTRCMDNAFHDGSHRYTDQYGYSIHWPT